MRGENWLWGLPWDKNILLNAEAIAEAICLMQKLFADKYTYFLLARNYLVPHSPYLQSFICTSNWWWQANYSSFVVLAVEENQTGIEIVETVIAAGKKTLRYQYPALKLNKE